MRVLVTGSAGFIGSHAVLALAAAGHSVYGLDCFFVNYDAAIKHSNHAAVEGSLDGFTELDLTADPLEAVVEGAEAIVHLAAIPGVHRSWVSFPEYLKTNVLGTQRLLEAAGSAGIGRFVFASSSSVYGETGAEPVDESSPCRPISPYGVTKAAGEALGLAYASSFRLPFLALRFFTVYGPRQRPDMATFKAIEAARSGRPFVVFGDGTQRRAFTYVGDAARSIAAACEASLPHQTLAINVSGGVTHSLNELLATVEAVTGRPVPVQAAPAQPGDPSAIEATIAAAGSLLGWCPEVDLSAGTKRQVAWQDATRRSPRRP